MVTVKIYMVSNAKFTYQLYLVNDDKEMLKNRAREHAKRIVTEGYWAKEDEFTEVFYGPAQIYKVKVIG